MSSSRRLILGHLARDSLREFCAMTHPLTGARTTEFGACSDTRRAHGLHMELSSRTRRSSASRVLHCPSSAQLSAPRPAPDYVPSQEIGSFRPGANGSRRIPIQRTQRAFYKIDSSTCERAASATVVPIDRACLRIVTPPSQCSMCHMPSRKYAECADAADRGDITGAPFSPQLGALVRLRGAAVVERLPLRQRLVVNA